MNMNIVIRNEIESDINAISEITKAAFETLAISNHTEQFIIKELRKADALTISLVAEVDYKVIGHIAFSPVSISDGSRDWYGLGPISVLPELQKQGIGKALIHAGLSSLKALGAKGCVLAGDPGYYERFGFRSPLDLFVEGVPQQYFLALPFNESKAGGTVVFHDAFSAKG
jgi:putative acetyltransferase